MTETWSQPGLLDMALEQLYNSVVITDADFADGGPHVLICNRAFLVMTGYELDEIRGRNLRILQGPDTDPAVIDRLRESIHGGRFFEGSTVNYRKDGTPYNVQWNISPLRDADGRVTHFVSVQQDVSERVRAQTERQMLAEVLEVVAEAIMVTDDRHRIVYVNRAFERLFGYSRAEVIGQTPRLLYEGSASEAAYEEVVRTLERHDPVREQLEIRTAEGRILHTVHTVTPHFHEDGTCRNVSAFTDVSVLVEEAQDLASKAETDDLTGLANRRAGRAILSARMNEVRTAGATMSVALCDIDHFKRVNDTYGHAAGDGVLREVARTLTSVLRGQDVAARWGGEEFLLVLPGTSLDAAVRAAERLRVAVEALDLPGVGRVTMSIGVSQALADDSSDRLVARADTALYTAKEAGRNRVVSA